MRPLPISPVVPRARAVDLEAAVRLAPAESSPHLGARGLLRLALGVPVLLSSLAFVASLAACSYDWGASGDAGADAAGADASTPDATVDDAQALSCGIPLSVDECSSSSQCASDKVCCLLCTAPARKCSPVAGCVGLGGLPLCGATPECTARGFTMCAGGICLK